MQTRITVDEMRAASRQLAKHERGRAAMRQLDTLLRAGELDLDLLDQRAFLTLLGGAWMGHRKEVSEILSELGQAE